MGWGIESNSTEPQENRGIMDGVSLFFRKLWIGNADDNDDDAVKMMDGSVVGV